MGPGAIAALIGSILGALYTITRTWVETTLKIIVDYEIEPTEVKTLKLLTVKGKVTAYVLSPFYPVRRVGVYPPYVPITIKGGSVTVKLAAQTLGTSTISTEDGSFSVQGPVILNPGTVKLLIYINNLTVTLFGISYTTRDFVVEDEVRIIKPKIDVIFNIPKEVYSGKPFLLQGVIKIDGKTPQEYSPYISKGRVTLTYNGEKVTTSIDPSTGKFFANITFEELREYTIIVDVVAFETFAYIGLWTQISVGFTRVISARARPPPIAIKSIEPEQPEEGQAITVTVETEPNTHISLEFDDVQVDEGWSDNNGICVLHVPSSKVKAGTHVIKAKWKDRPNISISKFIEVKAKPEVEIKIEAANASFPYGGVYEANIDTLKGTEYIPHKVTWRLGTLRHGEYFCETGASTLRLVFARQKYENYYVLALTIKVEAEGQVKIEQATIRIGRSTKPS